MLAFCAVKCLIDGIPACLEAVSESIVEFWLVFYDEEFHGYSLAQSGEELMKRPLQNRVFSFHGHPIESTLRQVADPPTGGNILFCTFPVSSRPFNENPSIFQGSLKGVVLYCCRDNGFTKDRTFSLLFTKRYIDLKDVTFNAIIITYKIYMVWILVIS